jgi:hypothetical protein
MSTRIDAAMAKANAAPSCTVNVVVWVMKPGPMAEVAIRNIAPISVDRVLVFIAPVDSEVGRPVRRTERWEPGLVGGLDGGGLAMVLS